MCPAPTLEAKWRFIRDGMSRFAGRALAIDDAVYRSASLTNTRNQAIGHLLPTFGRLGIDPARRSSSIRGNARSGHGEGSGRHGRDACRWRRESADRERVVDAASCQFTLAVMATAGLYETSGDWLFDVGLPGKSGIGGGIVTVSPGKGGFGTFAPRLDDAGNSVKGQSRRALPFGAPRPQPVRLDRREP